MSITLFTIVEHFVKTDVKLRALEETENMVDFKGDIKKVSEKFSHQKPLGMFLCTFKNCCTEAASIKPLQYIFEKAYKEMEIKAALMCVHGCFYCSHKLGDYG